VLSFAQQGAVAGGYSKGYTSNRRINVNKGWIV
jgi:hypothetical protein